MSYGNMKKYIILLALVCFSFNLLAQHKVSGKIVDQSNNQPISFVNVGLFRVADSAFLSGAASDDKGLFRLEGVPKGEHELRISAIGYDTYKQQITVDGDMRLGVIKLNQGSLKLDEVTVVESRPLFSVEGEKTMYNTAEDPSIQTGTASDALQNAPGVEVDVEGNITLRGASSVEVWINDQPSHLTEENLKTYIQSMPANAIDRIEVITNPSARYGSDADGIINIVTNAKIQRNEFFSFGLNAATRPSFSPWMSYVYANEKLTLNLYLNGRYSYDRGTSEGIDSTFVDGPDNNMLLSNWSSNDGRNKGDNFGGGLFGNFDYQIDSMNSINGWLGVMPNWSKDFEDEITHREEYIYQAGIYDYATSSAYNSMMFHGHGGLYYRHKFDNEGHQITVSVNGNGGGNSSSNEWNREFTSPYSYLRSQHTYNRSIDPSVSGEINYVRPYSRDGEISLGFTSRYSNQSTISDIDTLANGEYVPDVLRSYDYNTFTNTNQLYATLQHKWGGFTLKPGIRFENYNTGITYNPEGCYPMADTSNFRQSFFNVLPTLHLSYRTKSMHNFKASYTRRVNDPRANQLTTFVSYGEESFSSGNPDLTSVYTNSLEVGWTKFFQRFGSVGLSGYYKGKSNEINTISISRYDDLYGRYVMFRQPVNVGKSHDAGLEANLMIRPTGFFNMRLYANLYDSYIEAFYHDELVKSRMISYSVRMNLWAKVWNRLEIHAQAYYRSPTQSLFSTRESRYGINGGLRCDFFDRKMSVFLNVQDIFNWNKWGSTNNSPYYHSTNTSRFNSRSVSLGLTFRFGKMELEKQAREGGDEGGGMEGGEE